MAVDQCGVHVILSMTTGMLRCATVALFGGGMVSEKGHFPQVQMNYFSKQSKMKLHSVVSHFSPTLITILYVLNCIVTKHLVARR